MEIDNRISEMRRRKNHAKKIAEILEDYYGGKTTEANTRKRLVKEKVITREDAIPSDEMIGEMRDEARSLTKPISAAKEELCAALDRFDGVRVFRKEFVKDRNVISLFESALTRAMGIETNALTMDLVVVKTCYFKVLHDIILRGFDWNGERYVIYTASAGQIRTKRSVFIREAALNAVSPKLMCGLTIEDINRKGGINTNKFLAYLALSNSATDPWPEFDITKCIVVDDMETLVEGEVDYIDSKDYSITRKVMGVPVPHTDGAGMVRPDVCKKNFMVRLPWVKGLLASFPYDKFIREANRREPGVNHGLVTDIYGVEHDVLAEDIQIIFTKSQYKLWKYMDWRQYQENFQKYGCEAGICNMEDDVFEDAKINYQMLQTLTDLSDTELLAISERTRRKIRTVTSDRNTMLQVFGATAGNRRRNAFQESLMLYPELLQDEYCRDTLRMIKASLEKEAHAGRLDIAGKYTFLIPDMYAFCQWLFLGDKNPSGLLENGEVYCRLFEGGKELDCLRSPHLYLEHAVRRNMAGVNDEAKRWFQTDGIYTSCHDLISKILQFDVDGDRSLVVEDVTIVEAAKRNTRGIVPLYYEMAKAGAKPLTPENIYASMIAAYTGGNIGAISNQISKIWNFGKPIELDIVKILVMENNHVIDYAKTLFKPTRPDAVDERVKHYGSGKVPAFFVEAKDKKPTQVAPYVPTPVNRLRYLVPPSKLSFNASSLGKFDWRMLTSSTFIPNNDVTQNIIDTYRRRASRMSFRFNDENTNTNKDFLCQSLRDELLGIHPDPDFVADVLVKELFYRRKSRNKVVFWECFGKEVLTHLQHNVDRNSAMCLTCGKRFMKENGRQYLCPACQAKKRRRDEAERKRRARMRPHS